MCPIYIYTLSDFDIRLGQWDHSSYKKRSMQQWRLWGMPYTKGMFTWKPQKPNLPMSLWWMNIYYPICKISINNAYLITSSWHYFRRKATKMVHFFYLWCYPNVKLTHPHSSTVNSICVFPHILSMDGQKSMIFLIIFQIIKYHLLRSHCRNYGEHKGLAVLNSELSKLSP